MAKTISNFLVGIGFDLDKKSVDGVASGIDNVKSKALKLGSVVAGAFGVKALTSDFANAKDDLGKFAQVFGVTANDVNAFGNALKLEGGTLEQFMSQLSQLEQFRAGLTIGDADFLAQAGRAGLDVSGLINAKDATEGFLELADQFQAMTQLQRLNAANSLGLDEATIRLLSKGRAEIEKVVDVQRRMRPITDEMTESSRIFNEQNKNLTTNIGGFADQISTKLLPQINNVLAGMNDWIEANRTLLKSGLDSLLDAVDGSLVSIAASLGLIGVGAGISAIGGLAGAFGAKKEGKRVKGIGKGASSFGAVALAATGGAAIGTAILENLDEDVRDIIGESIATLVGSFGNQEARSFSRVFNPEVKMTTQLVLDGKVIDERVTRTVGAMADQAIEDTRSTEGP